MPKKQPKLYRTPRNLDIWAYNWPAMALGCLLLVVVNFIATQYIAPDSNTSLRSVRRCCRRSLVRLPPFSWIVWAGAIARRKMSAFAGLLRGE